MRNLIPIILSGGVGSRLWPLSRSQRPKPFMWVEESGSLLERTLNRVQQLNPTCVLSVTNADYALAHLGVTDTFDMPHRMILEPFGRNTAGAIGVASAYCAHHFGADSLLVVLPSDHIIENKKVFADTIQASTALAEQGYLVTLGINPTKPHTGYGYIEMGHSLTVDSLSDEKPLGFAVNSFVEKPDLATAQSYLNTGNYLWNAGIFIFTAQAYLTALQAHAPDTYHVVQQCDITADTVHLDSDIFAQMPNISVDYAVMERADKVAVVPALFDWNDLGSWDAVAESLPADEHNNRTKGQTLLYDTSNTTVFSTATGQDKMIATVGLDNITIVETRDAVLVADNHKLQGVKDVVQQLSDMNHPTVHQHRTEHRPWGTFTILDEGENYKVKQIMVYPQSSLSLQSHEHRSEHWVVVAGQATVVNGDKTITLYPNQSTYIPQGTKHRLTNETHTPTVLIEVQTGDYFGEDDITRYEDGYGRT